MLETEDGIAFQHLALQDESRCAPTPPQRRRLERALERLLIDA